MAGSHADGAALPDPASPLGPVRVIEPTKGWSLSRLREVVRFHELLYFLAWRDVKVRYKQTALGVLWAVLQPVLTMSIFSVIFGRFGGLDSKAGGLPYSLYIFAALLPWFFFAQTVNSGGTSLVGNTNLITKIYFPRIIIPLSSAGVALVDLSVALVAFFGLAAYHGIAPGWGLVLLPVFLVALVAAAIGVSALLAALTVSYRDFRYVVPFMLQLWLFVTPIVYPLAIFPKRWQFLAFFNPMTGIVEGFRAALLGTPLDWAGVSVSFAVVAVAFLAGLAYFLRTERSFADLI